MTEDTDVALDESAVLRGRARKGIQDWVAQAGHTLLHAAPTAILTAMSAAALAPVLVPVLAGASGPEVVQLLLAQVGQTGAGYLGEIAREVGFRLKSESRAVGVSEETLREVLKSLLEEELAGPHAARAREAVTALAQAVNGVNAALAAAQFSDVEGLFTRLSQAFADVSLLATEFHVFRADLLDSLDRLNYQYAQLLAADRDRRDSDERHSMEMFMLIREVRRGFARLATTAPGSVVSDGIRQVQGAPREGISPVSGTSTDGLDEAALRPYPGLASFGPDDMDWFYGRDRLIATLVNRLRERISGGTPLIVTGASGAGKSSVLWAGLLPELRGRGLAGQQTADWPEVTMRPGRKPLEFLGMHLAVLAGLLPSAVIDQMNDRPASARLITAQALLAHDRRRTAGRTAAGSRTGVRTVSGLAGSEPTRAGQPHGQRLVLVIDQFEEVFTECGDGAERKRFIDAICAMASGTGDDPPAALVVAGLNAAYIEHCTAHPELTPALDDPVTVGPMTATELRAAIEEPARQAGLTVQPGLVDTMLRDLGAVESADGSGNLTYEPGRLPLLSHALLATWERREGRQLTVAAYQAAGGINHALAATADGFYASLSEADKQSAKRLLLQMVRVDREDEDARRRLSKDALLARLPAADQAAAGRLLRRLEELRLVTADSESVQIAHEALLRNWPALTDWLRDGRDWYAAGQRLADQARDWDAAHRPGAMLLRGTALTAVQEKLAGEHRSWLGRLRGPGHAARATARERRTELGELAQAYLRASERRQAAGRVTVAAVALLLAVLTSVSVVFWAGARRAATLASQQQALAQSRALSAEATSLRLSNPEIALLLDLEAYRVQRSYEARSGLLTAQSSLYAAALHNVTGANAIAYDPAAPLLAVAGQSGGITVWRPGQSQPVFTLPGRSPCDAVAFDPTGRMLAAAGEDGTTVIWNLATRQPAATLGTAGGQSVDAVAFDPRGGLIAAAGIGGTVTLWRTGTWQQAGQLSASGTPVFSVAFSPDGTRLAAAGADQMAWVWDLAAPGRAPLRLSGHTGPVRAVAFAPAGTRPGVPLLASAGDDGTIRLWNAATGGRLGLLPGSLGRVDALAFNADGTLLASGADDGTVSLWGTATLTLAKTLPGPASVVTGLSFGSGGQTLASAYSDGTVGVWRVAAPPPPGGQPVTAIAAAAHASVLATTGDGRRMSLWTGPFASAASFLGPASPATAIAARGSLTPGLALSPDGTILAATPPGNQVIMWNTRTGRTQRLTAPGTLTILSISPAVGAPVIAAGNPDGYVYVWTGAPAAGQATPDVFGQPVQIDGQQGQINSLAFSPDGTMLAVGSQDGTFLLARHTAGGWVTERPVTGGPDGTVQSVAFSTDGRLLAIGLQNGASGTVQLWNISDPGRPARMATLTGPGGGITGLAFSGAGTLAASSSDKNIYLWDVSTPAAPRTDGTISGLAAPTGVTWQSVPALAHQSGATLNGAAPDGSLLSWVSSPDDVARAICASPFAAGAAAIKPYLLGAAYRPLCP
jgi:WD40 repeat protein